MNWENYPDIEIYLHTDNLETILDWLASCFESISPPEKTGNVFKLEGYSEGYLANHPIPITINHRAAGKRYTSITFDSNNTPWTADLDCARAAFTHTGVEVRCSAGSWEENSGDSGKEEWWEISVAGESRVHWDD